MNRMTRNSSTLVLCLLLTAAVGACSEDGEAGREIGNATSSGLDLSYPYWSQGTPGEHPTGFYVTEEGASATVNLYEAPMSETKVGVCKLGKEGTRVQGDYYTLTRPTELTLNQDLPSTWFWYMNELEEQDGLIVDGRPLESEPKAPNLKQGAKIWQLSYLAEGFCVYAIDTHRFGGACLTFSVGDEAAPAEGSDDHKDQYFVHADCRTKSVEDSAKGYLRVSEALDENLLKAEIEFP